MKRLLLALALLLAAQGALADKWAVKVTPAARQEDNKARSAAAEAGYRINPMPEYYAIDETRNGRRAEFATEAEARTFLNNMFRRSKSTPGSLFQYFNSADQIGQVVCIERTQPAQPATGPDGKPVPTAPDPRMALPTTGPANLGFIGSVDKAPGQDSLKNKLPVVPREQSDVLGEITLKVIDGRKITVTNASGVRLYFSYEYIETNIEGQKSIHKMTNDAFKYTQDETVYMNITNLDRRVITAIRVTGVSEKPF